MKIGSIVQVRTFSEYVVKTPVDLNDGYLAASGIPPGTYVSVAAREGKVVGIVTNVLHSVKEDYLPYLPEGKQEVFLPYATDYRSSYLIITGLGNIVDDKPIHELAFTPGINDLAETHGARGHQSLPPAKRQSELRLLPAAAAVGGPGHHRQRHRLCRESDAGVLAYA